MSARKVLPGEVRRSPDRRTTAVLWPGEPPRWLVTDEWNASRYESDEAVAGWAPIGTVPGSPAETHLPLLEDPEDGRMNTILRQAHEAGWSDETDLHFLVNRNVRLSRIVADLGWELRQRDGQIDHLRNRAKGVA
jgi:hypothetical protein